MQNNVTIEKLKVDEVDQAYEVIKETFDEFVGNGYSQEGINAFYDYVQAKDIEERLIDGNITLVAKADGKIVGIIDVCDNNHVSLFFVSKEAQGKGIGRMLHNAVVDEVKNKTAFLEVNASPYSVGIYKSLGFEETGEEMVRNGIVFIPMKLSLEK